LYPKIVTPTTSKAVIESLVTNVVAKQLDLPNLMTKAKMEMQKTGRRLTKILQNQAPRRKLQKTVIHHHQRMEKRRTKNKMMGQHNNRICPNLPR
jgi:hypothetical protein